MARLYVPLLLLNNIKNNGFHITDFLVKSNLPNATFALERSFAGSLPVNREGHPNNTLFFWGWEKSNGSLTRDADVNSTEYVPLNYP